MAEKILVEANGQIDEIIVVCYHRRFVPKDSKFYLSASTPQLVSIPFIIKIPTMPSGRRLYDEIWTMSSNLLKHNAKCQKSVNRWWERKDWKNHVSEFAMFKPFILQYVQKNGLSCSKCHWFKGCAGCIIEPNDAPQFIDDLGSEPTIVVEWHSETLVENYNS